jgi:ribosomal protein S18 acetylase RimI-like enzyme
LPQRCFASLVDITPLIKELHIDYITNAIQIGLVYISEHARGKGLVQRLLLEKIQQLKNAIKQDQEVYVQVFGNNTAAIKAYEKVGFQTVATKTTENLEILNFLPSANKILMKFNPKQI